jgi:hypothetical protein
MANHPSLVVLIFVDHQQNFFVIVIIHKKIDMKSLQNIGINLSDGIYNDKNNIFMENAIW